jgi:pimeloyl-ACP methyl ester carboxylesterase
VIALDLLGFGGSPRPDNCQYTPDEHCQAIHQTLKKLGVKKPFVIVAHSMGALLSVHYMAKWPNDVSRAVLVGMPVYLDASRLKGVSRLQNSFYSQAYKFFRSHQKFTIDGAQTIRRLLRLEEGIDVTNDDWQSFSLSLRNTIEKQNTYNELQDIDAPLTLIYGTLDEFAVRSNVEAITRAHENITTQVVRGSDHVVDSKIAEQIMVALKGGAE